MPEEAMEREEMPKPSAMPGTFGAMPPPAPVEIEEEFAEATETVSGIAIYEIPKKMTIPFDKEEHPVTLTEEDLESKSVHHWYPDGMSEVIAQDVVTNGNSVILPGSVKVFAESNYIGETSFAMISPREEFKIGTRVANDVKGEKKLVEREVEKAGMMRGKLRRSYRYRLEVTNFSKQVIEINIFDRVPHSLTPSIEVKADWDKIAMNNMELGVLEWKRTIEPKAKQTIEYAFEVQWEKDITISPALP